MAARLLAVAVDCNDVDVMTEFWTMALQTGVSDRWTDSHGKQYVEISLGTGDVVLLLQPVVETKSVKNRVHLDLATVAGSQDDEVERLCRAGASVIDLAPDDPWVVLADPEDNEFCVLPPR
jgi:hypothetical protein